MARRTQILAAVAVLLLAQVPAAPAQGGSLRLLKPKFEQTGHQPPTPQQPAPRSNALEWLDLAVLAATLSLASFIALRQRSRRSMVWLTIFCLLYFGFWRKGCVCPVGSIQNMTHALADRAYAVPLVVVAFFALPLVFALFFGRVFCAAVCPLGALQEVVVFRPVQLPRHVAEALGILRYVYLGLAVTFVAGGASYIVCRYDPFIGFYRLGASLPMLVFGAALLVLGMFVGRPYCRFLCPYGVLLGWCSRLSLRHVTITPDECIQCRLCEEACPYGAILAATPPAIPEARSAGVRRLALLLVLTPLLAAGGAALGSGLAVPLSLANRTVRLAERVRAEELGSVTEMTLDSETWRKSKQQPHELYAGALAARRTFRHGGLWLGGFLGLVLSGKLLTLSVYRGRRDYVPDSDRCLSCTRCFMSCPKERERRKASDARKE